jgi:hypothetical protein
LKGTYRSRYLLWHLSVDINLGSALSADTRFLIMVKDCAHTGLLMLDYVFGHGGGFI